MANTTLNTRIILCNDTTVEWGKSVKVLQKGEMAIEIIEGQSPKIKIGNGESTFAQLPYTTMTPAEITSAINDAITKANHTHTNKTILDKIEAALTNALKANYDAAYQHAQAAHAPSNAQANIIEEIKVNGVKQNPDGKSVNVKVPTKVSELNNDSGFITKDTKYTLETPVSATNGTAKITLKGNDSTTDDVIVKGTGATTVTTDTSGNIVINSTDTKYSHPTSGVSAGAYTKVTVDTNGHVTKGENPTTLAGYGISDAIQKGTKFGDSDITGLNASKLTGTIDIARLPQGALERCVIVKDDAARLALTKSQVQTGDTVKVTDTGKMYFVVDDSKLNTEEGYEIYTAGSATSVPWSGITGKPETFTPSAHNHQMSEVTGLDTALAGKATSAQGAKADTAVQSVKLNGVEKKVGTTVELPAYPTTLPASDVHPWAKAATKPTYNKNEVGLGNVTNDKQVKGLATGTSVNHVVTWGADGYTVKDSGFTIESNVPANAKFTDTTYAIANGSTAGLVKSATGTNKVAVAGDGTMSVSSVSTDIIANGVNTLILNGGGAV